MTRPPDPQRRERVAVPAGQSGDISEVSQQPGAGVPDDTRPSASATIFGRDR
jgi:hypothetical protein